MQGPTLDFNQDIDGRPPEELKRIHERRSKNLLEDRCVDALKLGLPIATAYEISNTVTTSITAK